MWGYVRGGHTVINSKQDLVSLLQFPKEHIIVLQYFSSLIDFILTLQTFFSVEGFIMYDYSVYFFFGKYLPLECFFTSKLLGTHWSAIYFPRLCSIVCLNKKVYFISTLPSTQKEHTIKWFEMKFGFKNWIELRFQQPISNKTISSMHSEDILRCILTPLLRTSPQPPLPDCDKAFPCNVEYSA